LDVQACPHARPAVPAWHRSGGAPGRVYIGRPGVLFGDLGKGRDDAIRGEKSCLPTGGGVGEISARPSRERVHTAGTGGPVCDSGTTSIPRGGAKKAGGKPGSRAIGTRRDQSATEDRLLRDKPGLVERARAAGSWASDRCVVQRQPATSRVHSIEKWTTASGFQPDDWAGPPRAGYLPGSASTRWGPRCREGRWGGARSFQNVGRRSGPSGRVRTRNHGPNRHARRREHLSPQPGSWGPRARGPDERVNRPVSPGQPFRTPG